MKAKDLMTADVVTVTPDTPVDEIARLMLARRISAVPVVDANNHPVGIVSEGDLMKRPESETLSRPSWWLRLLESEGAEAGTYVKTHGLHARDVMAREVVTVEEETEATEIAALLEERHIKRVPVLRDGRVAGLVSRADLVRAIASAGELPAPAANDEGSIRERILEEIRNQDWGRRINVSVVVTGGVAHLWGPVHSDAERNALRVAAENTPGVTATEDHTITIPHWWEFGGENDYE